MEYFTEYINLMSVALNLYDFMMTNCKVQNIWKYFSDCMFKYFLVICSADQN